MSDDHNAAFEMLKQDFPFFELTNRKNVSAEIPLANNDSLIVREGATVKVASSKLIQLPDMLRFKFVSPSMDDLVNYGVVKRTGAPVAKQAQQSESNQGESPEASGSKKPVVNESEPGPLPNSPVPDTPETLDDGRPQQVSTTKKSSGGNK